MLTVPEKEVAAFGWVGVNTGQTGKHYFPSVAYAGPGWPGCQSVPRRGQRGPQTAFLLYHPSPSIYFLAVYPKIRPGLGCFICKLGKLPFSQAEVREWNHTRT